MCACFQSLSSRGQSSQVLLASSRPAGLTAAHRLFTFPFLRPTPGQVLEVSRGDMRKAVTTLQSVATLYGPGKASPAAVEEVTGVLPAAAMATLWAAIESNKFEQLQQVGRLRALSPPPPPPLCRPCAVFFFAATSLPPLRSLPAMCFNGGLRAWRSGPR